MENAQIMRTLCDTHQVTPKPPHTQCKTIKSVVKAHADVRCRGREEQHIAAWGVGVIQKSTTLFQRRWHFIVGLGVGKI